MSYTFPTIIIPILELNGGVYGTVKPTDVYPAVDVTDQTQSPTGTTKPYQIVELVNFIINSIGFPVYGPCLALTTSDLNANYNNGSSGVGATLTNAAAQMPFTADGQTGVLNGRYLVSNQTDQYENGIYVLTDTGSLSSNWVLTRSIDFNSSSNIYNDGVVYVINGNLYANTLWQDSFISPLTVGTTDIVWTEFDIKPPAPFPWTIVTNVSVDTVPNAGYRTDRTGTPVQVVLPSTFELGDIIIVLGNGAGGWSLIPNFGQTIQFGSQTASNSINSDIQYSNITVRGLVPDTTWVVIETNSNPTFS